MHNLTKKIAVLAGISIMNLSYIIVPPQRVLTQDTQLGLDKIVISEVKWHNDGATARCLDTTYHYAAIIDHKNIADVHFFKGTECALGFRAEPRSDVDWVEISEIRVDVTAYKLLNNCALRVPAPAMSAPVFYVEINAPLNGQQSFSASKYVNEDTVMTFKGWRIENNKPENLIIRINATDQGVYSFRVVIKVKAPDGRPAREMQIGTDEKWYFR